MSGRNGHSSTNQAPLFRVRFQELFVGPNGGLGPPKNCKMRLRNPEDASKKLRTRARIISVRQIKR